MAFLVNVVKPFLLKLALHPEVKNLVVSLLEKYAKTTDNTIDDAIVRAVKSALFKQQA
jgi:hypothetical protein